MWYLLNPMSFVGEVQFSSYSNHFLWTCLKISFKMGIDRFEFFSNYVDDNVAGYYTKIIEFDALAPAGGQGSPMNAFAVRLR